MNVTSTNNSVTAAKLNTTMGIVKVNETFSKYKCKCKDPGGLQLQNIVYEFRIFGFLLISPWISPRFSLIIALVLFNNQVQIHSLS